jgi:hypothetical protein
MTLARLSRAQLVTWAVVSLLFGAMSIFPAIAFRVDPTVGFRGVEMEPTDAETHYAARVQEIRDGSWSASNVYYAGDKDQPYLQPPVPEWIVSGLGRVVGFNAPQSLALSQFVLGALLCAIMIGCFTALTGRFWWALVGVSAYVFAGYMYSGPWMLWRLLTNTQGTLEFLTFARPINPQWSATLFFGALWAFTHWHQSRSRLALAIAGVLTILSYYSYIYVWTLLGMIYLVVGVKDLVQREYARVKELLMLAALLLIGLVPYGLNVWSAMHHPFSTETSMRLGLIHAHAPQLGITLVLLLVVSAIALKRIHSAAWIVIAFTFAAFIVQNQQIISGQEIVLSHYHWYFTKPFVMILGTVFACSWAYDRWGKQWSSHHVLKNTFVPLTVAVLLICGALYQWRSYQVALPFWREQQAAAGTLSYLKVQTKPGDVTYASGFIRDLIPVYTSGDVYWGTNAYGYLSSDERARDAYFFDLWLKGVSAEEADETFSTTRREELSSRIHAIYYREARGSFGAIPDEEVSDAIQTYRAFLSQPFEQKMAKYPLHYIVRSATDPDTAGWREIEQYSTEIYRDDAFVIRKAQGS